jgi:hypothetical protein
MDPAIASMPELAARFNITVPSGFGYDVAGVVDEVGDGASGFLVGEQVYGGVMERAAADFVVVKTPPAAREALFHTPAGLSDDVGARWPLLVPPLRPHWRRSNSGRRTPSSSGGRPAVSAYSPYNWPASRAQP